MRPLTIHCLAGSTFELHVDDAETGLEVRERVAGSVGLSAASIMLASGDRVLDLQQPLLQQSENQEITYVVRKFGAGRAAQGIERALARAELSDDKDAMSAVAALTFGSSFNQRLEGVQLPSGLQTLTFGSGFNRRLEEVQFPGGLQTLTFGHDFDQGLEGVQFPSSLQTLTFGRDSTRAWKGCSFPAAYGH